MMISENKYFIFDKEISVCRYIYNYLLRAILTPFYRVYFLLAKTKFINKKYYASICAIFKNEGPYLKEWIEFHRIVGFRHFYLYNNFSSDDFKEVLEPYIEEGIVTLIDWPVKQGQMRAYEHCVNNYSDETNWIAFIDIDEFVFSNVEDDINCVLKKFEKRPIVIAYWKLFGTSGYIDRNKKSLVVNDFWQCWRKYTNIGKYFYNTSFSYKTKEDFGMHYKFTSYKNHELPPVNFYDKIVLLGINVVNDNFPPVQINHYFTKSYYEYHNKKTKGDAFFEINPKDDKYFYEHEKGCISSDYNIRKYLIKLKLATGETKDEYITE